MNRTAPKAFRFVDDQGPLTGTPDITDTQRHRATRTVASNARDVYDCALLLDMLDLVPDGMRLAIPLEHGCGSL